MRKENNPDWIIKNYSQFIDTDGQGNVTITTSEYGFEEIEFLFDVMKINYKMDEFYCVKNREMEPKYFEFQFKLEDIHNYCSKTYNRLTVIETIKRKSVR